MAVWSRFAAKNIQQLEIAKRLIASLKHGAQRKGVNYVPVRNSHDRTLQIKSSTYINYKVKDLFYFYFTLGLIPFGLVILYTNIFIGPAKLALIPEGYQPKHWEYYEHPITRFFAKYLTPSKQELYERTCDALFVKKERCDIVKLENKIIDLMKKREDYQSWYFDAPPVKYWRHVNKDVKESFEDTTMGPGWIK